MTNICKNLNPEQLKAVEEKDGFILVIAGAGSGKTRVLTLRVAHLIQKGVSPYSILAITFTNKAANEMKRRIAEVADGGFNVLTSTFHSFCAKILRIDCENLGYKRNFSIYTETETSRTLKRILKDNSDNEEKTCDKYAWHISQAKNSMLSPEQYYAEIKDYVVDANEIVKIYAQYENELKSSNALDFDDLLLKTVELFRNFPDVLLKYQKRYEYINVDEFQDTNMLQFELVKMLSAYHGNLFAVGDEDQSIYSWRGARISNILDFPKVFKDAKVFKLEQNYRSTPQILKTANNVIANNKMRNFKNLWTDIKNGNEISYFEAHNERVEADFVARNIARGVSMGGNYADFAVLVRANSLTRIIEENFALYGIPYKVFGGFKFFERKEIKDFTAFLRLSVNPSDNDSFLRAISYPKRGIGDVAISQLKSLIDEAHPSFFAALEKVEESDIATGVKTKLMQFASLVKQMVELKNELPPDKFAASVLDLSGLNTALTNGNDDDKNRLENMLEFVSAIGIFIKDNSGGTIEDFLQSVALISDTDEMDNGNYVTVSTVHAVKGLEFENVFIIGAEENIFPTRKSIDSGDIEEERRLMYVAITRAKSRLAVSWTKSRYRFNQVEYNLKSRFVTEMDGFIKKTETAAEKRALPQNKSKATMSHRAENIMKSSVKAVSADYDKYKKDCFVEHSRFGRGLIIATEGEGENKICSIAFDSLGVKKFALSVAIKVLKIVD